MSRPESKIKMGYYPFGDQLKEKPMSEQQWGVKTLNQRQVEKYVIDLIGSVPKGSKIFDPFAGEGRMISNFLEIGFEVYGNELDQGRAAQLAQRLGKAHGFHSSFEEVSASRSGFQAAWINPPYDYSSDTPINRREHHYMNMVLSSEYVQPGGYNFIVVYDTHLTLGFLQTFFRFNDFVDLWIVPGWHFGAYKQVVLVGKQIYPRRTVGEANDVTYKFFDNIESFKKELGTEKHLYHIPSADQIRKFWYKPTRITPENLTNIVIEEGAHLLPNFIEDITSENEIPIPQPVIEPNVGQIAGLIRSGMMDGMILQVDGQPVSIKTIYEKKTFSQGVDIAYNNKGEPVKETSTYIDKTVSATNILYSDGRVLSLGDDISFYDFIQDHGDELLEYIKTTYKPLFDMHDDAEPFWIAVENILENNQFRLKGKHKLFYNQRKVVAATIKKLVHDRGMILSGTMGVGKSVISLATAYVMYMLGYIKDDQFVVIMCPKIMKKNWYREIESTVKPEELNIIIVDTVEQTADFIRDVKSGTGKLNILIVDEYRAKADESRLFAGIPTGNVRADKYRKQYLNPVAQSKEDRVFFEEKGNQKETYLPYGYENSDQFWWVVNGELYKANGLGEHPIARYSKKPRVPSRAEEYNKIQQKLYMQIKDLSKSMDSIGEVFNLVFQNDNLSDEQIDYAHEYNRKFREFKNRVEFGRWITEPDFIEFVNRINELRQLVILLPIDYSNALDALDSIMDNISTKRNESFSYQNNPFTLREFMKKIRKNPERLKSHPSPMYQQKRSYSSLQQQNKYDIRERIALSKTMKKEKLIRALPSIRDAINQLNLNPDIGDRRLKSIQRLAKPLKKMIELNNFWEFYNNLTEIMKYIKVDESILNAFDYIELMLKDTPKHILPLPQTIRPDLNDSSTWIAHPEDYLIYEAHKERTIDTIDGKYEYRRVNSAISVSDYLTHVAPNDIAMLIADEAHEYRNMSARGVAFLRIASKAKYILAPTGTSFTGKVSSLFFLLHAISPKTMKAFEFSQRGLDKWIDYMGSRERKITVSYKTDKQRGHVSRSSSTEVKSEAPGANSRLMRISLNTSLVFLISELYSPYDLDENGNQRKLVDYEEIILRSTKDPVVWEHIKPYLQTITGYMLKLAAKNDGSFAGKWYHAMWSIPKAHYMSQDIYHRRKIKIHEWDEKKEKLLKDKFIVVDESYIERGQQYVIVEKLVCSYEGLPVVSEEEKELAVRVQSGLKEGRNQCIFVRQTSKNIQDRLKKIIEDMIPEANCIIMTDNNPADKADRQEFVIENMKPKGKHNVFIVNTQLVQVGLNLLPLVDIHNYELMATYTTMAQSSRRSLRADQTENVRVYYYISQTPTRIDTFLDEETGELIEKEVLDGPPLFEGLLGQSLSKAMTAAKFINGEELTAFNEVGDSDDVESDMMKEARRAAMKIINEDRFGNKVEYIEDDNKNNVIFTKSDYSELKDVPNQLSLIPKIQDPYRGMYDGLPVGETDADKVYAVYKGVMQDGEDAWHFGLDCDDDRIFTFSWIGFGAGMGELGWTGKGHFAKCVKRIDYFAENNFAFYPGIDLAQLKDNFDKWADSLLEYNRYSSQEATTTIVEPESEFEVEVEEELELNIEFSEPEPEIEPEPEPEPEEIPVIVVEVKKNKYRWL